MHFTVITYLNHIYPVMILVSFLAGTGISFWMNIKRGVERSSAFMLVLTQFLFGLIGGFALTFITSNGTSIGLSSLGGLAGMYLGSLLIAKVAKKPYYWQIFAQDCTLVLPLMYSISKIGCHFAGCCAGVPYKGWGSVTYINSDIAGDYHPELFPVQLTETVVFACIFILGAVLFKKHVKDASYGIFALSAAAKFLLDFLRSSHTGLVLSFTQVLCALLLVSICVGYVIKSFIQDMPNTQK